MSVLTKPTNRISATEARVHFGEIYRRVTENDETIIVERNGTPGMVILPIEAYELLRRAESGDAANGPSELPSWYQNMVSVATEYREVHKGERIEDGVDLVRVSREERDAQLLEGLS